MSGRIDIDIDILLYDPFLRVTLSFGGVAGYVCDEEWPLKCVIWRAVFQSSQLR